MRAARTGTRRRYHAAAALSTRPLEIMRALRYSRRMSEHADPAAPREIRTARYRIGQIVKHRVYPFRGVIFDVDPTFSNTEEWWLAIPEEVRPVKDQPFYHLYAENETSYYVAYVSEQNLLPDDSGEPVEHPDVEDMFGDLRDGAYELHDDLRH
jgi:heat shock protein HspQ